MTTSYIKVSGQQIAASIEKPNNRLFRDAWQLEGSVITVDMTKARDIQRDKLREARKPLLEQLDADFMKALEQAEDTTSIAEQKQKLRDLTADIRINEAATLETLAALTADFLLNN